jgi:outer membrane receptor protein involved in Fe transport
MSQFRPRSLVKTQPRRRLRRLAHAAATLALICALLVAAAPHTFAQTFRGTILGTVTDPQGAVVVGATVTARNLDTGVERTTITDDTGNFSIPELPIGRYEVKVQATGFQPYAVTDVRVEVASERRVDPQLAVGGTDTITITANAVQVETTSNTLGGTISSREIVDLPINGRDFTKLIVLAPGATGDPSGATDSPGSFGLFSANGNRGRSNNYLLDGTDMNDGYRNLPAINEAGVFGTPATILPVEAIAEAAILSNFEAEYGRNSGAIVNLVTKSGTNSVHGSAFEFLRDNMFDARNFFNTKPNPQTEFSNHQFGFAAGGPFVRNRTFWFAAYEGQREDVGLNSVARVPDPREIAALGGATNPVIAKLLQRNPWPAPNNPVPLFDPSPNLFVTTPATNNVDSFIGKIDHSFNEKNQITGRYYFGTSDQSFPLAILAGNVLPGYNTVTPTTVHLVSFSFLKILSSQKVNEARFGYNRFDEGFFPEDRDFDPNSIGLNTGISGQQDFGLPFIRIRNDPNFGSSLASLGSTLSVPRARVDTNWHFIDNLSWKLNRHDLKMGYEFRRTFVDAFFDAGYRGRLDFASLEDFLSGTLSGGRAARGDSRRKTFQNSHAGYLQDTFRVNKNLTLNLGLRYDYFGVIGEKNDLLSNFDPERGLVQVGNGIDRLYDRDLNNFSPRIGFAWDITGKGKSVVRAGWGMFYDAFSQDFFVGQLPFNTFNPGPAYNPVGPAPVLFSFSTVDVIQPGVPVFTDFLDSDVFAVDRHMRTPYVQNYNLNIQQELFKNVVLEVGYIGSTGAKLFRYRDINQPVNPGVSTARPFDNGPFAPSGGTFFYVNYLETTANSNYNALQATLSIRDRHGFSSQFNYTWSHSIDNASDGQDYVANATQPDNSFRTDLERGNSNFDVRQRFTWTWSYIVPSFWKDHPRIGDGWQLNGIVTLRTGAPFHVNLFDDYNGTGEFFPRPDIVGDPYAGTHAPDNFLNLSAFKVPCTLDPSGDGSAAACIPGTQHFGSLGRNSLRGPGYSNFDFSIFKTTPINDRFKLQFRAEIFNIFNHPNFSSPLLPGFSADASFNGIDPVSGRGIGFLPITVTPDVGIGNPFLGGGGPRNIQLAFKLVF